MKLIFLLTLTFFSCSKPNPLDAHIGIWAVTHGYSREVNTKNLFYLTVTQEQIDSKNITLIGTKLTIHNAELCCPFIFGKQEFDILIWNDTMLVLQPKIPLPDIHTNKSYYENDEVILTKCKPFKNFIPQSIGITSFALDSISPINYMIDIENGTTAYFQYFNHADHCNRNIATSSDLKIRKLSRQERIIYNELMKYHKFDTIYNPNYDIGCRMGSYFIDVGFNFQGKNYPMNYYGKDHPNSNLALQGFLLTIAKTGKWNTIKRKRDFSSQLEYYTERKNPQKTLLFIPPVK